MLGRKRYVGAAVGLVLLIAMAVVPSTASGQLAIDELCVVNCGNGGETAEVDCWSDATEAQTSCEEDFGDMTVEYAIIKYCSQGDCDGDLDSDQTTGEIHLQANDCNSDPPWCIQKIYWDYSVEAGVPLDPDPENNNDGDCGYWDENGNSDIDNLVGWITDGTYDGECGLTGVEGYWYVGLDSND